MQTKKELESRLIKAGIDPGVFAELLWDKLKRKVDRADILAATVSGLAVRWNGESSQSMAELAERLTDAIMRLEEKRS